jgi:hypothetical protein
LKSWMVASRYDPDIPGGGEISTRILADAPAREKRGREPKTGFEELIRMMVGSDLQLACARTASMRCAPASELQESKCDC